MNLELNKSIDVAWAGLQRAKLRKNDSRNRIGYIAPADSVDEPTDDVQEGEGPPLNPTEALTISSQKEFVQWLVDKKKDSEEYTRDDVEVAFGEAIGGTSGFLTTSYISYDQDRNVARWNEFKKAGIFKKIIIFPKLCLYEVAKSCLSNAQHFSVKLFLTKFPLSKELQMLTILYIYNIILQPRVFTTILPLILTYFSFCVMVVYSYRIILANFELEFSIKNIIPLLAVEDDLNPILVHYFRSKNSLTYTVFFLSCVVFLLSLPVSGTGSSLITIVSLLFLFLSALIQLTIRENKLSSFLVLIYHINFELPVQLPPLLLLTLIALSFALIVFRYIKRGLSLRIWPPIFFLMWGQTFLVARHYTSLNTAFVSSLDSAYVKGFFLIFSVVLFVLFLRKYVVHIILPSAFYVLFLYPSYTLLSITVFFLLTLFSILISRYFGNHRLYDWFLSLNPFDVTFSRVMWAGLSLLLLISVVKGLMQSSRKLPPLTWDNYTEWCIPHEGWGDANEAKYQLRCLHLAGRNVSVEGEVLSVSLKSRENPMEYYFDKLQMIYLGEGLKCIFGQNTLSQEDCEAWREKGDENICQYSKCSISMGAKYSFEIIIETKHKGVSSKMKIEASNNFMNEIKELSIHQRIGVNADIINPGSKYVHLKLKCIHRPDKPCSSQGGLTRDSSLRYLQEVLSINFKMSLV